MVTLIDTLRTFETYQKMIQSMDETVKQAANELGRA
jgi:flagellar basal body rod protein FlgG